MAIGWMVVPLPRSDEGCFCVTAPPVLMGLEISTGGWAGRQAYTIIGEGQANTKVTNTTTTRNCDQHYYYYYYYYYYYCYCYYYCYYHR